MRRIRLLREQWKVCLGINGGAEMSGKRSKAMRRSVERYNKRLQKKLIKDFLRTVDCFSFKGRVKLALRIIFKKA